MVRNRIIPIFVPHVGCPHQCAFCNQRHIAAAAATVDGAAVARLIEAGLQASGTGAEAAFYGGSFTAISASLQEELLGAVQPFLEDGRISAIRLSTRPDALGGGVLPRLRRFGVKTVELGSQSMDDGVLQRCGRGHTAADTVQAAARLKEAGFSLALQMMTGLPGSSADLDLETARQLLVLRPDGIRIYPTVVVRDTALAQWYEAGTYRPQTLEEAAAVCAAIFRLCLQAGVPVLRMGLQPTEELSRGAALAGPYHPAFGEFVKSRFLYEEACRLLDRETARRVTLLVRRDRISALIGQRRATILALQARYPQKQLRVCAGECGEWEIRLQSGENPDTITR